MREPDLLEIFARPLHQAGARYLVAGSLGAMLYSEPRLTLDIDIPVILAQALLEALPTLYPEPDFYCPPQSVVVAENKRECRAHFNILHLPSGLKADFYPAQTDSFFAWSWEHKLTAEHPAGPIHYAPPEYVLVWKTVYFAEGGSEKHVRDVRRMLEVSRDSIDLLVVEKELVRRGLWACFQSML